MEPRKVLFVDDERNILNALKRLPRSEKYRSVFAQGGREALHILEQEDVHVIVTDLNMPEMDGLELIRQGWKDLLPPAYREGVLAFAGDFNSAMNRYFRAQTLVASIVGVLFAVGFWLIGLPMGILLGLFIGALNIVPYLQIIGLIPAFLLALVHAMETGASLWVALGLTGLVFVVVQTIQDVVLVPKIMGRVTGLSPAIILLSLSIWGKLLGIFGLLIALPMTCLLLAYYKRFLTSAWARDSSPPTSDG